MFGFASMACAYNPTVPLYANHLGASAFEVGLIMSMSGLMGILLRGPAGALSSVIGRKALLLTGSLIYMLAPLVLLLTDSLPFVFVAMAIYGLTNLYMPAAISLVNDLVPAERRGTYISYYSMWGSLGRVFAPALAGYLIWTVGYDYVFIVSFGLGVVSFLFVLTLPSGLRPAPRPRRSISGQVMDELREVAREPRLMFAAAARGLQAISMGAMNTYFPLYAKEIVGLTESRIGILTSVQVAGGLISRPITGILSTRWSRLPFMVGGMVGAGTILLLIPQTIWFYALMGCTFSMGLMMGIMQVSTIAYVSDVAGAARFGAAVGVLGTCFDTGLVTGRFVPGLLLPVEGPAADDYLFAYGTIASIVMASAILVPFFLRKRGPRGFA